MQILTILCVAYFMAIIYSLAFLYSVEYWGKKAQAWFWLTCPITL